MSFKIVMHPETKKLMKIDTNKEPRWMFDYLHRNTATPFANPVEEVGMDLVASSENIMTLEEIQAKYVEVTGKGLPAAYKNNKEWLLAKINA